MQSPTEFTRPSSAPTNYSPDPSWHGTTERQRWLLAWLAYFCIRYAAQWLIGLPLATGYAHLWYPSTGLFFFIFLAFGWRSVLPVFAIEALLGPIWMTASAVGVNPLTQWPFGGFLIYTVPWVFAYSVAALGLRAWNASRISNTFTDQAYTSRFLGVAFVGSAFATGIGTLSLWYMGLISSEQWYRFWIHWLLSDLAGIVTITPLLLVHLSPRLRGWFQWGRWRQSALPQDWDHHQQRWRKFAYLISLLLMLAALFESPAQLGWHGKYPFQILFVLLPMAWIAIAGGLSVATMAILVLNAGLHALVMWRGISGSTLYYPLIMLAVALTGLILGGITEARDRIFDLYRALSRVSNDLLWDTNENGRLIHLSGGLAWELAPGLGRWWRAGIRSIPVNHRKALSAALQARKPFREIMISIYDHANEIHWLRVNGVAYRDELGRFAGYRGVATDVTPQFEAEQLLADYAHRLQDEVRAQTITLEQMNRDLALSEQRYRAMLASAPVGVAEVDTEGRCRYVNAFWCTLTGHEAEALLGQSWIACLHPGQHTEAAQIVMSGSQEGHPSAGNGEFQSRTDQWLSVHWSTLCDQAGAVTGAIVILNDITDRRLREQESWQLAHFDTLTQLPNRILFWDRLEYALRLASRNDRHSAAVLWLDLDGFKAVNDTLGHAAGDELLKQVAQRLQESVRESDTAARMGGDEFTVVLSTITHPTDATSVAQKIIEQIHQPFALAHGTAHVSTSIGIALYPDHADTAEELVRRADQAMYVAKQGGKNAWRLWDVTTSSP